MNKIQKIIFALKQKKVYKGEVQRINPEEKHDLYSKGVLKIINILNYTRRRTVSYSGASFSTGYHTIDLSGVELKGQRNPNLRFEKIPFSLEGMSALDIGCNQGGMLHAVADKLNYGVGLDFDSRMINAANKIKSYNKSHNLDFFVFNLDEEDFMYITDLLPESKVDIIFLLSVCKWIKKWQELITFCSEISDKMLFETNGTQEVQDAQIQFLKQTYTHVEVINEKSTDDKTQKDRIMLYCSK